MENKAYLGILINISKSKPYFRERSRYCNASISYKETKSHSILVTYTVTRLVREGGLWMLSREQPWDETDGKCTVGSRDKSHIVQFAEHAAASAFCAFHKP